MSEHALLSASSSDRWIQCPGSIALCKDLPDTSSKFADEGTRAHTVAAEALLQNLRVSDLLGKALPDKGGTFVFDDSDMSDYVQSYVDLVRDYTQDGTLFVEKRVDYSNFIGVPDSFGTSDAIIVSEDGKELIIIDLKYGKGVQVDADNNSQMMLYALGAIDEFSALGNDFERVRMVIHQPRLNHLSEWTCTLGELMEFAAEARKAAEIAMVVYNGTIAKVSSNSQFLFPSEKACRFCKAKSFCPTLETKITAELGEGFDEIVEYPTQLTRRIPNMKPDYLAEKMKAIPLIEAWCKAIRARVESELLSGNAVDGFKLVRGRQGSRQWANKEEAEAVLKAMRLKQEEMYSFELISPTTAEKVLKDNPRRWAKVEELIVRKDGAISVAPENDKRSALVITQADSGFDVVGDNEYGE